MASCRRSLRSVPIGSLLARRKGRQPVLPMLIACMSSAAPNETRCLSRYERCLLHFTRHPCEMAHHLARLSAGRIYRQHPVKMALLLLENPLHHARADTELPPILRIPSSLAFSSRIRASTAGLTRRRPSLVPFALARARPALILSRMIPRSNSVELMDRLRSSAAAL